jgi:hypothetical protein
MGTERNAYRILAERPEGKRQLGGPKCRCVANIKMDLREIGWCGMDWIDLSEDRDQQKALVITVLNLRLPYNVGKFLCSCTTGSFSRMAQIHEISYSVEI